MTAAPVMSCSDADHLPAVMPCLGIHASVHVVVHGVVTHSRQVSE